MPSNPNVESSENAEFNLKHRVTGAAVLLFLGAAVLPWLLGPPSQASKVVSSTTIENTDELSADIQEADLLIDSGIDVEETVYISKITPMDANNKSGSQQTSEKAPLVQKQTTTVDSSADQKKQDDNRKKADQAALAKEALEKEQQEKKRQLAESAAKKKQEEQDQTDATESALQAKLAKEKALASNKIDVGWIVQVGLFTEKDRAVAFISELKNKGFSASSNVVDTNRGKNTGTRVWLGPFARKAGAANEVKRLKAKAAKDGFIRVYP